MAINALARTAAALAVASTSTWSLLIATPIAHADDPLPPIVNAVRGIRAQSNCPGLNYRGDLQDAAQGYAGGGQITGNGYPGTVHGYKNTGDPEDEAIDHTLATAKWALLDCKNKDFGVGFLRVGETDTVVIALGEPDPPPPSPPPAPAPVPVPAPVPQPVPLPAPPPTAPTDAVKMTLEKQGLGEVVTITNTSDLPGQCTYVASPANNPLLPTINRNVSLTAKGNAQINVPAPPILTTYHLVLSCHGSFNGKTVEFGHVEEDVSG